MKGDGNITFGQEGEGFDFQNFEFESSSEDTLKLEEFKQGLASLGEIQRNQHTFNFDDNDEEEEQFFKELA